MIMNNEGKVRLTTKAVVLGKAKAKGMSYEDIEEAGATRAANDAMKGKGKLGRKRKSRQVRKYYWEQGQSDEAEQLSDCRAWINYGQASKSLLSWMWRTTLHQSQYLGIKGSTTFCSARRDVRKQNFPTDPPAQPQMSQPHVWQPQIYYNFTEITITTLPLTQYQM